MFLRQACRGDGMVDKGTLRKELRCEKVSGYAFGRGVSALWGFAFLWFGLMLASAR